MIQLEMVSTSACAMQGFVEQPSGIFSEPHLLVITMMRELMLALPALASFWFEQRLTVVLVSVPASVAPVVLRFGAVEPALWQPVVPQLLFTMV